MKLKELMLNNKKVCISVISGIVVIIVLIAAIVIKISSVNNSGQNDNAVALNNQSSETISDNKTKEMMSDENVTTKDSNLSDSDETVASDTLQVKQASTEAVDSDNVSDNNYVDDSEASDSELYQNQNDNTDSDSVGSDTDSSEAVNVNNNSNKNGTAQNRIVYNDDGSLNIKECYWEDYKGKKEFRDAIGSSPEFLQLLNKAAGLGITARSWSLTDVKYKAVYPGTPKDIWYFIYPEGFDYSYTFGYDGNDFYFVRQGFMTIGTVGGGSSEEFDNNIVYRADGTLNLQESYWHYEDEESLYNSIISTPEFKQAINGYRSVQIRYPKTEGKITAKLQQWIIGYPDGSEYHFLFDGAKYCRMPKWSD
mgnify:FL=1|jgi:hypothetical protein